MKPSILYVDADANACDAFRATYQAHYRVRTARTLAEAVLEALQEPPSVAVVCAGPRSSPLNAMACAAQLSRHTRVLLATAHASDYGLAELSSVGAKDFVPLPWDAATFPGTLARHTL